MSVSVLGTDPAPLLKGAPTGKHRELSTSREGAQYPVARLTKGLRKHTGQGLTGARVWVPDKQLTTAVTQTITKTFLAERKKR